MSKELITQMLEALEWSFPNSTRLTQEHRAAITAAREYMAAPEQSEPEYWQWRRKTKPWEETYIFRHEQFATTDDSEVRKLYTTLQPTPEPSYWEEEAKRYAGNADYWRERCKAPEPVNQRLLEALKLIASCESRVKGDVVDVARAAISAAAAAAAAAEQAPQPAELPDDYLDPFVDVVYKHWQDPSTFDHGSIREDFRAVLAAQKGKA